MAASVRYASNPLAPLDWRYDLSILVASRSESASFAVRSPELFPLADAIGLGLDEILRFAPDVAALAIEHALSAFLDALERRFGERLNVVEVSRVVAGEGDYVERDLIVGERPLRLALDQRGRIARAFLKVGEPAPRAAPETPPRGAWRLVVGPLDLPNGAPASLAHGDALVFEPTDLPAALQGDDGALWAGLRFDRGAFRVEAKGRVAPGRGYWIELDAAPPPPETLIAGDSIAVDPGRARLVGPGGAFDGRLVEIDGRLGFQGGETQP